MRIEEIHIDRFGGVTDLRICNLDKGLSVIIGPNEAGKSTALEFIRSMFFGFRKRSGRSVVNTYETRDGAPRKGRLVICDGGGERHCVERVERPGKKEGALTITDIQGHPRDPSSIPILNRGMERSAYEALFAFDLDRMRELDREALRGKIVAAALGSLEVNPLEVVAQVDQELKDLTRKSSGNGYSLTTLRARLDELDGEIRSIKERPALYSRVKEEFDRVCERRQEIASEIPRKESSLANLTRLLHWEEAWAKLLAIENRLEELSHVHSFPLNGSAMMDQALGRLQEARMTEEELLSQLGQLQSRFESIVPDTTLLERREEMLALERRARMLATRPSEIEALRLRVEQAKRGLLNDIQELGDGWSIERIGACNVSLAMEQTTQRYVDAWRSAREAVIDGERRLATAEESLHRLRERVRSTQHTISALEPACRGYLGLRQRELVAEWKERHLTATHLRDKLSDKTRLLERFSADRHELEQERVLRKASLGRVSSVAKTAASACILSVLGAGAILSATGVAQQFYPPAGIYLQRLSGYSALAEPAVLMSVGAVAIMAAAGLVLIHFARKRRRATALRDLGALDTKISALAVDAARVSNEQAVIRGELELAVRRMSETAREALGFSEARLEDVLMAERRSLQAEGPVRKREFAQHALATDLAEAERQGRATREIKVGVEHARNEFRLLQARWRSFVERNGLTENLEPEATRELVRRLTVLKRELREIIDDEDVLVRLQGQWDEFAAEVAAFAKTIARDDDPPLDAVARWTAEANHAREQVIEKQSVAERLVDLKTRLAQERKKVEQAETSIHALLEQAAASDEPAFREQALLSDEFRRLTGEREILVRDLVAGLRCTDERSMRSLMAVQHWEANQRVAAELGSETARLREESEELAHHAGRLGRQVEEMETEQLAERLLTEKEELTARLSEGVRRWIILRLASQLLGQTLEKCEREKQPKVMERSSEIFQAITGSAFSAVRFPMEGDAISAVRNDGSVVEEGLLSRGTLEQVYLSMRLAHLEVHHRGDSVFPLVMDDILVNFDETRATRTARVLTDFAEETGIQVLFFTCHRHTAELFPARVAKIHLIV